MRPPTSKAINRLCQLEEWLDRAASRSEKGRLVVNRIKRRLDNLQYKGQILPHVADILAAIHEHNRQIKAKRDLEKRELDLESSFED